LDLEDGVPPEQNGSIVAMKPAYNEVVVLTDASDPVAAGLIDSGLGNPFEPHHWSSRSGAMTLWRFDGSWHHLWQSSTTLPGAALDVSSAYGKLRAYWSAHGHALYQALQASTLNPRANPTVPSAPSGSHTTSWYPFGLETQLKIHGHLTLRTSGCTATEKVEVYYAIADDTTSLDTAPWTKIATITTDGQHTIQLGGPQGQSAYYFRYRFDLSRGSTVTARPVIEFVSAEWMHVLPATYAFSVDVDLSESFHGKTPAQMLKTLSTFADHKRTPQLQLFSYQDQLDNTTRTHYARITRLSGASFTGASERHAGTVQLGIIAPYLEDAESAP
jgi:hypothetical protein